MLLGKSISSPISMEDVLNYSQVTDYFSALAACRKQNIQNVFKLTSQCMELSYD